MAFSTVQQMLALAFISDLDAGPIDGTVCENATALLPKIKIGLDALNLIGGTDYELVWGPAVFAFNFGGLVPKFSDNTLFVVQSRSDPSQYVVATAGTDSVSIADWVLEDFWTGTTVPWPYGTATTNPRISVASLLGLIICQTLVPCGGLPGAGQSLKQFLKAAVTAAGSPLTITTTGHSLGGSLSPLMALWLCDTQGTTNVHPKEIWDPNSSATLIAYSFAGATSGDVNWANHFESQFDAQHAFRVWNQYDVVPHAWNVAGIAKTPTLYSSTPNPDIQKIADNAIAEVGALNYQHWQNDAPPLQGSKLIMTDAYWLQAAYQHTIGYWVGLGMPWFSDPLKSAAGDAVRFIEHL
jgi:Lipase (class 3).